MRFEEICWKLAAKVLKPGDYVECMKECIGLRIGDTYTVGNTENMIHKD